VLSHDVHGLQGARLGDSPHRLPEIRRKGHLMIRTLGLRGLVIALLAASAGMAASSAAQADPRGAQSELTAVTGQGVGKVIVSPTSVDVATFVAQVEVNIHDAAPDTTFTITRAVDAPADGICTSTSFATVATLRTSAGGAGAVEFERTGPILNFDLFLRVIGGDGTVLESQCMIIVGK
jgi:hypothetical protein